MLLTTVCAVVVSLNRRIKTDKPQETQSDSLIAVMHHRARSVIRRYIRHGPGRLGCSFREWFVRPHHPVSG